MSAVAYNRVSFVLNLVLFAILFLRADQGPESHGPVFCSSMVWGDTVTFTCPERS